MAYAIKYGTDSERTRRRCAHELAAFERAGFSRANSVDANSEIQIGFLHPAGDVLPSGAHLHPSAVLADEVDVRTIDGFIEDLSISPRRVSNRHVDFRNDRRA